MIKGFQLNFTDSAQPVLEFGSQMVMITDATSKQLERQNELILEARNRMVCINIFTSTVADGSYENIANRTHGTLVYPFSSWTLANFIALNEPCVYTQSNQQLSVPTPTTSASSVCQDFNVTQFASLIKLSISAQAGRTVALTRPNHSQTLITVESGNFAIFSEDHPLPGNWQACINIGNLVISVAQTLLIDITVVYIDGGMRTTSAIPPACKW